MSYGDYMVELSLYYAIYKGNVRYAQACMNCLPKEISDKIVGTDLDIFYMDNPPSDWFSKIHAFFPDY
jgi:hypothetical protein